MDATIDELKDLLDEYGVSMGKGAERYLQRCAKLCEKYSLKPDDLSEAWIAFAATHENPEMDDETLDAFEKKELSSRKEAPAKPTVSLADLKLKTSAVGKLEVYGQSTFVDLDSDNDMDNDEDSDVLKAYGVISANTGTPKAEKKPAVRFKSHVSDTPCGDFSPLGYSPAVQSKSVSYGARTKAGDTVLRYKCKDSDYWKDITGGNEQSVKIVPVSSTQLFMRSQSGFKYMFQRTADMAASLNSVIVEIADAMLNESERDLQDLRVSSVEECWYLGRICNEDGRLSQGSTTLEGDLDISGGHIVSLDLSATEEYRLFPGQVVLIKGKNEMGKCLRVSEVAVASPLPLPTISLSETRPINIIVASGPFTPIDSMQYEPLTDLIEVLKRDTPDVCILAGPFIDPTHPMIAGGELAETFDEFFEKMLEKVRQSVSNLNTKIVVISSSKDAHHHPVYPTPPYDFNKNSENITILPDPAMFEIAGITIGFTSIDILKHLANSEIAKSTITDRLGGLSKLILSQRNFYPLYPPDESVPLDVQLWARHCRFSKTPHILILPSDLRFFIKEIEGTIVMNPERLTKGKSGGTYARFQVKLPDTAETKVQSVADFCCGEIIKI